ncbi:putative 2-dehydro-3-deoxy-phosphogluconate aldolase [Helianthus debilis subsp. tardiflorus]
MSPLLLPNFSTPSSSFNFVPPPPPPVTIRPPALRCYHSPPSISTPEATLTNILNSGVIACLRTQSPDVALEAARAAITAGISVLEIVVSTPGVFEVLHQLVQDFPTTTLGVGTVLNTKDAENAKNAGAKFIMSPAIVKGILDQDNDDLLYIPGVMTPTEILSSYNAGAKIVKVYPVSAIGGVQYIATLKKPFPHIPMVASQGITTDSVGAYIDGGASAVVLSDAIFDKKAISQRNFTAIYRLAQLAALQGDAAVKRKEKIYPG